MNVEELLELEIDSHLTISTGVFTLTATSEVELEGETIHRWLFGSEDLLLAIKPEEEEMMLFTLLETTVEKDDNIVVEQGKDYEFSYQDRGHVKTAAGAGPYDENDELEFSDYEADDGDVIRLITNTFNGEERAYLGHMVTEEDILRQE